MTTDTTNLTDIGARARIVQQSGIDAQALQHCGRVRDLRDEASRQLMRVEDDVRRANTTAQALADDVLALLDIVATLERQLREQEERYHAMSE